MKRSSSIHSWLRGERKASIRIEFDKNSQKQTEATYLRAKFRLWKSKSDMGLYSGGGEEAFELPPAGLGAARGPGAAKTAVAAVAMARRVLVNIFNRFLG